MIILDPGHRYQLHHLDGYATEILTFVKRQGDKYPGNTSSYEGTNIQEVLRALIDRVQYINKQIPDKRNDYVLESLRNAFYWLENRAAFRHNRALVGVDFNKIESYEVCDNCKHIGCQGECRL